MAFALTDYQIAALQEMHIPVWQHQDNVTVAAKPDTPVKASVVSQPVSQDTARSHLQRLKESVSTSKAKVSAEPPLQDLDANIYAAFFQDIAQVLALMNVVGVPVVKIGAPVTVSASIITLPVTPDKLTAEHKKQLWQTLCSLS